MGGMESMASRDGVDDDLDFEMEVSDLLRAPGAETAHNGQQADGSAREGADARGAALKAMGVAQAAAAAGAHETPAEVGAFPTARAIDRTAWLRAARPFTVRRLRGYAVTGLVVLVCAGLLLSQPGTQQALRQTLAGPTPTPTAPLASGANHIYFEGEAPWGRLTLDGTPLAPQAGQSASLRHGRHTLTYAAAPWAPLRCQLSVPAQPRDSCPVDSTITVGNEPRARVVNLGTTPDRLPAAQRTALAKAVASALQANVETAVVPPGDHYRSADGRIAVATLPLRATMVLTLNTDATRPTSNFGPGPCVSLCSDPGVDDGGAAWWLIWAHAIAHLRFMAADGAIVDPDSSADLDVSYPLGATWSGTWSVTTHHYADSQQYLCYAALQRAFPDSGPLPSSSGWSETTYLGPNDVEGCVAVLSPGILGSSGWVVGNANATPTPLPADAALFIIRFGMVLAGNAAAHAAQPLLPVASAHERALARQWMTQP
jgi:hypothetical protein